MKKFIYLLTLLKSLFLFSQITAKIVAIKDGDTVVALLDNKTQETLRLADVDCPENRQPFWKKCQAIHQFAGFLGRMLPFIELEKIVTEEL